MLLVFVIRDDFYSFLHNSITGPRVTLKPLQNRHPVFLKQSKHFYLGDAIEPYDVPGLEASVRGSTLKSFFPCGLRSHVAPVDNLPDPWLNIESKSCSKIYLTSDKSPHS